MTVATRLLAIEPAWTTSYLSTGLNALANGSQQVGAAIDNSGRLPLLRVRITLASLTPTAGGSVDVYIIPGESGGDNNECDNTNAPQDTWLRFRFRLRAGAAAQKLISELIPAERYFKIGIVNRSGVALGATLNIVDYRLASETMETPP